MKKKVCIRICGRQFLNGESDETVVEAIGTLEAKENVSKLEYDEYPEENGGAVHNTITFSDRGIKIEKRGALVSDLFFVEKKARAITYKTPYGVLSMESRCKNICMQKDNDMICITIEYDLYSADELISECITEISVKDAEE